MNPLRRFRDWCIGPGGWLADSNLDQQLSDTDIELDQEQNTWADRMNAEDENYPNEIHIVHSEHYGWAYWFQTPSGLITHNGGYKTQGKAWRAALLNREYHQQ